MRRGQRLPDDQTEIVFSDVFVEQLEALHDDDQVGVLAAIVHLCADPAGKHALGNKDDTVLAGWNTLDVLATEHRVVYRASNQYGTGLVEVLCLGMRRGSVVYDMADALKDSGALSDGQVTQLWIALSLLDVVAEKVGLDGWDYRSPPAPAGMVRAVVAAGLLSQHIAELLSKDEIEAAQTEGWGPAGADPAKALQAAMRRARDRVTPPDSRTFVESRQQPRCLAYMPRARAACIRQKGHPGPHRSH